MSAKSAVTGRSSSSRRDGGLGLRGLAPGGTLRVAVGAAAEDRREHGLAGVGRLDHDLEGGSADLHDVAAREHRGDRRRVPR